MSNLSWALDLVVVGLLAITLVHAVRLEKALGVLRQDRGALTEALAGVDSCAKEAEAGISRLQSTAAEQLRLLTTQIDRATLLRDDLRFLAERGDGVADRLDAAVRTSRAAVAPPPPEPTPVPKLRSQAERELLQALRGA